MPVCLHCSRTFLSKEALHQHIRSSSVEHPFCAPCDRRFISQAACDSHMAAKHPPTFDCVTCCRSFPALFALEDHYRGSVAHPNCAKCGRGFMDIIERDEHQAAAHPKVLCQPCGVLLYEDSLEEHYVQSSEHPSCKQCSRGLKDAFTLEKHMTIDHPDLRCEKCERQFETAEAVQIHYFASPMHPECSLCSLGFKDEDEFSMHMQSHQPLAEVDLEHGALYAGSVHGFSPLGPRTFKDLVGGDVRNDMTASPVLSLQMDYASPIKDVQTPLFSPATLPRPGRFVEEVWNARDNVQAPFFRAPQRPLDWSAVAGVVPSPLAQIPLSMNDSDKQLDRPLTYYSSSTVSNTHPEQGMSENSQRTSYTEAQSLQNMAFPDLSESRLPLAPTTSWRALPPVPLAGSKQSPDNRAAGQHSTSVKYGLYAGTALSRFRSSDLLSPSTSESKAPLGSSLIHPFGRSFINWREVMGDRDPLIKGDGKSSLSDDISTQAVDTPVHKSAVLDSSSSPLDADSLSPHSASLPGSSCSPWTTPPPAGNSPHQNLSLYITSPTDPPPSNSSSSHFSQSPEVFSPIGLAALPIVAPLVSTPVDVRSDQGPVGIPDFQEPTSESPKSPLHIAFATKLPDSPSIESLASSQHSFATITSPQDSNWDQPFQGDILAVKLPDSPTLGHASSSALGSSPGRHHESEHDIKRTETPVAHVQLSASPTGTGLPGEDAWPPSPVRTGTPSAARYPRLQCGLCHTDPCVETTATMCGHIFCYRCITDEIIKNSRCPTCTTPTLLYCLFRLHLSA